MKPDAELSFQVIHYGMRKLVDGDIDTWLALGLSIDDIRIMENLDGKALHHLSRLGPRFLHIQLDYPGFANSLRHVQQEATMEDLQDEMLRRQAPFPMMRALFGMTSSQYANRRKLLGMAGVGIGRPHSPSDEAHGLVWHAWRDQAGLPERERYLAVSRRTRITLNTIWTLVKGWESTAKNCSATPTRSIRV